MSGPAAIVRALGDKGYDVSRRTAERIWEDGVSVAESGVVTAADQPSRAAEAIGRNVKRGGYAIGFAGAAGGAGLTYSEMLKKDRARMENATDREKLELLRGVLNDPDVKDENKAEIISSLSDAGVFSESQKKTALEQMGLPDPFKGQSLDPGKVLGGGGIFGGIAGWIMFLILVWAAVKVYKASVGGGSGGN